MGKGEDTESDGREVNSREEHLLSIHKSARALMSQKIFLNINDKKTFIVILSYAF